MSHGFEHVHSGPTDRIQHKPIFGYLLVIVMMICHYDDTNSSGGLDRQARLLIRTLRAHGEDVVMLGSTRKWSQRGWHDDQGVPVRLFWTYYSPQVSGRYLPASLIWAVQLLLWVLRNKANVQAIHIHQIRIHAFVAAIAHKFFKIPTIIKSATGGKGADIRAIGSRKYFGPWGRDFIVRNTDCFVATTEAIRQDLLEASVPDSKITIIPNGMVLPSTSSPAAETLERDRASRCLFLARLDKDKNPVAIAKAAIASSAGRNFELDFYGEGKEAEKLTQIIESQPNPHIRYLGFTDKPQEILSHYGYLILASDAEGLSNSMIEAMVHGVVPVATRVSGCVDHIAAGENGYFLDGTDQASLMLGFELIANTPVQKWQAMSVATSEYAARRFDISNVARSYHTLYADLSANMKMSASS